MMHMDWHPFHDGTTVGGIGSENGRILRDEEYQGYCRITLEKNGNAPYSITCGVYGLMVHTVYTGNEADAELKYEGMKKDLLGFLESEEDEVVWCNFFTAKWYR